MGITFLIIGAILLIIAFTAFSDWYGNSTLGSAVTLVLTGSVGMFLLILGFFINDADVAEYEKPYTEKLLTVKERWKKYPKELWLGKFTQKKHST